MTTRLPSSSGWSCSQLLEPEQGWLPSLRLQLARKPNPCYRDLTPAWLRIMDHQTGSSPPVRRLLGRVGHGMVLRLSPAENTCKRTERASRNKTVRLCDRLQRTKRPKSLQMQWPDDAFLRFIVSLFRSATGQWPKSISIACFA